MSEDTVHPASQRPETQDPENQPLPGATGPDTQPPPGDNQDTGTRRLYPSDPTGDDPRP
ncbi:hypothetical protein H9657_17880 [Cellulomonas sp. Sa3CUA2]|uniref:Uncharacterized protein n=1 Tax=Cellulomonas avistercoris TaxID=2762242 RepID=A0ABR8QII4_9CELL|nr:hypothetical protein [Cellulomonas avistercoris]MBD7920146.1 hypothetical protein [Cellulomonas avistercoris]